AARAVAVVGVIAGANDGRIADAPRIFPGPAAGADAARDITLFVQCDDVDGAKSLVTIIADAGSDLRVFGGAVHEFAHGGVALAEACDTSFKDGFGVVRQQIA